MRMPKGTREVVPIVAGDEGVDVSYPAPGGAGRVLYVRGKHLSDDAALHTVSLDGSNDRLEIRGTHGWVVGDGLLYVRNDLRAIRRRVGTTGVDETLFEAPSGKKFFDVVASPDGAWAATSSTNLNSPDSTSDLCFGSIALGPTLDCASAGKMPSGKPTFAPTSGGIYSARKGGVARFDLATKQTT